MNRLLKDGLGRFSGRHPLNASAQSSLRQSDSVHGQITRDVIQAVGRMGRTFLKNPSVHLFTTEKTLYDLDLACLNGRILSPEMEVLRKGESIWVVEKSALIIPIMKRNAKRPEAMHIFCGC